MRALVGLIEPAAVTLRIDGYSGRGLPDTMDNVGAVLDVGVVRPGRSGRSHLSARRRPVEISDSRSSS